MKQPDIDDDEMIALKEAHKDQCIYQNSHFSFHHIILLLKNEAVNINAFNHDFNFPVYPDMPWVNNIKKLARNTDCDPARVVDGSVRALLSATLAKDIASVRVEKGWKLYGCVF
jgi:hypothetical protein